LVIFASSNGNPAALNIQFALTSGTAPWYTLQKYDGSGVPFAVFSGTGSAVGLVGHPCTPYARLSLSAPTTDTISYFITERRAPN
jgi:hypothetical protein